MGTLEKKPTSVTVIGWIFIAITILMVLTGAMGFMAFRLLQQKEVLMTKDTPILFKLIFQYSYILAFLQIIFAIFVMIASIQFLKLRPWARTALEIISWLSLVYVIIVSIFCVVKTGMILSSPGAESTSCMFNILGVVAVILVTIVWAIPLIVIIKFLRGTTIKEAIIQKKRNEDKIYL